jgi:hypothetical protein
MRAHFFSVLLFRRMKCAARAPKNNKTKSKSALPDSCRCGLRGARPKENLLRQAACKHDSTMAELPCAQGSQEPRPSLPGRRQSRTWMDRAKIPRPIPPRAVGPPAAVGHCCLRRPRALQITPLVRNQQRTSARGDPLGASGRAPPSEVSCKSP